MITRPGSLYGKQSDSCNQKNKQSTYNSPSMYSQITFTLSTPTVQARSIRTHVVVRGLWGPRISDSRRLILAGLWVHHVGVRNAESIGGIPVPIASGVAITIRRFRHGRAQYGFESAAILYSRWLVSVRVGVVCWCVGGRCRLLCSFRLAFLASEPNSHVL